MEKQTVTIYDVAREANVSMATVSRVVNGNANVKAGTKEKVQAVIKELGYRPNAIARGLASKRTTTIGLILPDLTDQYYVELARGIDDVAKMYKYQIILTSAGESSEKNLEVIDNLLGKQVDGIIYMGNHIDEEVDDRLDSIDVPVVFAGSVDSENQHPSVNINYIEAFEQATSMLLANDHEKVAFISGDLEHAINKDHKLKGYQFALEKKGMAVNPDLIFQGSYVYEAGYAMAKDIIATGATAAIAVNDSMAAGVVNGLTDAGVKIPEDFEIITSNNTALTSMTRPQLSSITQPIYDLGAVAMRVLTKLLDQDELAEKQIELPHGYVERATTN